MPGHELNSIWTNLTDEEVIASFISGDYKIPHSGYDRCCVNSTSNQSIPKNVWTTLNFNNELYDIGGLHSNITNNSRIIIAKSGAYMIVYHVDFESGDKYAHNSRILKNGVEIVGSCIDTVGSKDSSAVCHGSVLPLQDLAVGDYIELQHRHDSLTSQDVYFPDTFLAAERRY